MKCVDNKRSRPKGDTIPQDTEQISKQSCSRTAVIVHQSSEKSCSKKCRTAQYSTMKFLRDTVYDLFDDYALDTDDDRLDFVKSLEKDILQSDKRFHAGAMELQLQSLPLAQRNELIKSFCFFL